MKLKTFLETFTAALAADSDLSAWAAVNFGRSLSIYKDLPSDTFPSIEDDYPFVVLMPADKASGQQTPRIEYGLEAWLGINKSAYISRAESDVTEPAGVDLICDFIDKVKVAVAAAMPANTSVSFVEMVDALGRTPECDGYIEMNFIEVVTIGTDPLD